MTHAQQLVSPFPCSPTPSNDGGVESPIQTQPTKSDEKPCQADQFERQLGDSETSYFLPSRENGVNDMYLHIGFDAPERLVHRDRVRVVWAILRALHPLLSSKVEMHNYHDSRFVYAPPQTVEDALSSADQNLKYCFLTKDELLDSYLNGPRTLSNDRLSFLMVSQPHASTLPTPPHTPDPSSPAESQTLDLEQFELFICAAHFLGDGMALHQFANDFFSLLGSTRSQSELENLLEKEHQACLERCVDDKSALPNALEDNLLVPGGRLRSVAGRVDHMKHGEKQIGGHTFPRRSDPVRHTIVPTVPFDPEHTKRILKVCKAHGVSISAALFAICNVAWARTCDKDWTLPMLMYSALNLRPSFNVKPKNDSYWFLAVSYFNIILPTFLPLSGSVGDTFWRRAQLAKEQSTKAAKNCMIVSRSLETARERGQRSRVWAKEDDEKAMGTWTPPPLAPKADVKSSPRAPTSALIGLSLLGNLDSIYKHGVFPDLRLHTLTTGSRQRRGGMLMFGYTFAGRLWVSLGYDENGFEKKIVENFWNNVLDAIHELLV